MHVAVYIPLLIPALAALAARPLAARLRPVLATWVLTLSALALAAASSAVLGMLVLSALLRIPFVAALGDLSGPVISRGDAVSLPVAVLAGGLLAAAAVAASRAVWRRASAIAASYRRASTLPGAGEIVVTEDAAADAYTVPGWPCRIVITRGMLSALAGEERGILLSHERAHARNAHYLFTSAVRLAAAANPLLGPVAAEVGYAVERWADEHAATVAGNRTLTARAIARAALAASAAPPDRDPAIAALGLISEHEQEREKEREKEREQTRQADAGRRRGRPGQVPRRVAALLSPPPGRSPLLLAAAVALVIVSGASAAEAARDFHQLIELAQVSRG